MKRNRKIERKVSKRIFNSILILFCFVFFGIANGYAQEVDREKIKDLRTSQVLMNDASNALQKEQFPTAEADYRKAIALNPASETAKYNLGNAYYERAKNGEANQRFRQAAEVATNKPDKHKAFHNLGNTFMNDKKYQEAVDAYKNALRANPKDDETRYNLALAKKMLEEEQNDGAGDEDDKEQDKEQEQDNKDKKDDQGDNDDGDEGDEKEDEDEGEEKEDEKKGDDEKDQGKPEDQKEGEEEQPKQEQPAPGQLSPQQVKNLLEAMNNEEKKVQDKMNAQKEKGAKVKSKKDW